MSNEIHTETVEYSANGTTCRGYLAYDRRVEGARPGVIVVHEWWGLDDYIKGRARMRAEIGYSALALDMYGDGQCGSSPDEAGALMNGVLGDMGAGTARLQAGFEALTAQATADASRTAAIGYCFGGAMVLHMARIGMNLAGVVSFHGALGSFHKPDPGSVGAKVLVCHGAADQLVPDADIDAFHQEMEGAGVDYRFEAYEGALHGFSNPHATANGEKYGLPLAYDAAVDERSWNDMRGFFDEILAG